MHSIRICMGIGICVREWVREWGCGGGCCVFSEYLLGGRGTSSHGECWYTSLSYAPLYAFVQPLGIMVFQVYEHAFCYALEYCSLYSSVVFVYGFGYAVSYALVHHIVYYLL